MKEIIDIILGLSLICLMFKFMVGYFRQFKLKDIIYGVLGALGMYMTLVIAIGFAPIN